MVLHTIMTMAIRASAASWYRPRAGQAVLRRDVRLAMECEIGPAEAWKDRPSFVDLDEAPPSSGWLRLRWDGQLIFECPIIERDQKTVMLRPHETPGRFFLSPREIAFSQVLDSIFGAGYDFMISDGLDSAAPGERDHFAEVIDDGVAWGPLPVSESPAPRSRVTRIRHEIHGRLSERFSRTPKSIKRALPSRR